VGSAWLLAKLAIALAHRFGLIDKPGGRRKHKGIVARLGALPMWGAFTLSALLAAALPVERADPNELIRLVGLLAGGTFIFVVGILDDKFDLPPVPQFMAQAIAALIAVSNLIIVERFNNPLNGQTIILESATLVLIISLFWLMGMMNTVNWLDGVDGLSAGVNLIAAGLLFIHTLREGQLSVSLLPLALMGTMLGFLRFNWYPASLFMGSGAVYLGFTIGALSIIGGAKMATILLVMGLPLLDVAWQIARRLARGVNPLRGDRGHTHFRLIDAGLSPRWLVLGYYTFCTLFGALALLTTSRQFKFIALLVMGALALAGIGLVARYGAGQPSQKPPDQHRQS
jgi:UDP-GlcNAc:undecaprenyl-phosphate/decaprenyl-phosphate GlcNAc-1-phosphate transferase